jgi:hypothetical protein
MTFLKTTPDNNYAVAHKQGWRLSADPIENWTRRHGPPGLAQSVAGPRTCVAQDGIGSLHPMASRFWPCFPFILHNYLYAV